MKYFFFLIFFIISLISAGQNAIAGNWKIVSINNGEIYHNFQKDSISVFPEFGETDIDASRLTEIKTTTKMIYGDTKFSYDEKGNFKWIFMPSIEITGKYEVDEKKQIIKMEGKNSFGKTSLEIFPYSLKNGQLEIVITLSEPPGKYVFEKM